MYRIFDIAGILHCCYGHDEGIFCCLVIDKESFQNNSSDVVISGSGDGVLICWDVKTGVAVDILEKHEADVHCVDANRKWIVSGDASCCIAVWLRNRVDVFSTLRHFLTPAGSAASERRGSGNKIGGGGGGCHLGVVRLLRLHPRCEDRLLSAGDFRCVLVWDLRKGTLLHQVHRQQISVKELFLGDAYFVTSSHDGEIAITAYW